MLEAIDQHDHAGLCEELGDFMFEAVFLAQLESEAGHFTIADALTGIADKLVRRHPHVFARTEGEAPLDTARVLTRWAEIKKQERGGAEKPKTLLSGIPATLPALLHAYEIGIRARSVGFDWNNVPDVITKIQEEVDELREVLHPGGATLSGSPTIDRDRAEDEMGDLLFTIAHLSRQLGIEPETALRKANDKFTRRFGLMEEAVESSGRTMSDLPLDELEAQWQIAKRQA